MEMAILGLPSSGKSTLFSIMIGGEASGSFGDPFVVGIARIPDERFSKLVDIFKPKKATPATVPFMDINAAYSEKMKNKISGTDGILHVVDGFTTDSAKEMAKRYNELEYDLILSDLAVVEKRIERLAKTQKKSMKPDEITHMDLMPKLLQIF